MAKTRSYWTLGLGAVLLVVIIPLAIFWPKSAQAKDNPWDSVPRHVTHTDHKDIVQGGFVTGQEVTRACLTCHPDASKEMMVTTHFTWQSAPFDVPWREEPVTIGKANQINNFCIGTQGNEKRCMTCHVGYGWAESDFDFNNPENVDCLACHADTATYAKGEYGNPALGTDLLAAAQSVRAPTRDNCGKCHFDGGGGNGVKHGDLDESLYFPAENLDVHMGKLDFVCTDCHRTENHVVKGRMVADNYTIDPTEQVACTDCHIETPHEDARLNLHTDAVACQTCHIPAIALKDPTKTTWDWSTAGQDIGDDHYTYLKIKGSFTYERNYQPEYLWFNGNLEYRYLLGDKMDPMKPTYINIPAGSINDPNAKIFPFKLHIAKQPYDTVNNYLLQPRTAGEDGFWTNFDWPSALALGAQDTGMEFSGEYGFAETWMYWPTTHMVQPAENALQCDACHSDNGRLDWEALGYPGDPIEWGGR
ncbi:MAG: tetrathionate reductase family octaheme c-type cytochrome [Anaerolineaceae bacterium]|nr:MAG: tetrathionate reductase family octaheme c-type cytochrome [Anaerolineaceae bacterium]